MGGVMMQCERCNDTGSVPAKAWNSDGCYELGKDPYEPKENNSTKQCPDCRPWNWPYHKGLTQC